MVKDTKSSWCDQSRLSKRSILNDLNRALECSHKGSPCMKAPPALVLFFLAPAIAELLSSSAPPSEFFNPTTLLLLASLYGSGAIIVRELKVRWNKGYVSMLVLGAAYGIVEEGLMVKSFFDPGWVDLGILASYGRWQGVNWVWAEWLTIYHAVFSISIPITLVELAYGQRRNKSWVGHKTLTVLVALLGAVTALGYLGLTDYKPPFMQYALSAAMVIALITLAWKIPPQTAKKGSHQPLKPSRLAIAGFLSAASLFLLFMIGPYTIPQAPALMILGLALVLANASFLKRYMWNDKTVYNKFALAAGAVAFLIALTPLQEFNASRPDDPRGMVIVGIVALILLVLLKRQLKPPLQAVNNQLRPTEVAVAFSVEAAIALEFDRSRASDNSIVKGIISCFHQKYRRPE